MLIGILALYYFTKLPEGVRLSLFNFGPNAIAALLEINLPFVIIIAYNAFSKNLSIIYKFISCSAALLCIFALVATGSRGALIGFFAGLVILFLIKIKIAKQWSFNIKKVSVIMLLGICFVGSVFLKTDFQLVRSYDMERVRLVESSYNMWKDNKLLGVGLNNWRENYVSKYILPDARERLDFPHNTVAYFFSASGIIGGIGFLIFTFGILAFLINVLKLDYNNIYIQAMLWAFIAFSVHGLFDLGFLMKQSERLIFTYLGITCANIIFKTYYLNKDNK